MDVTRRTVLKAAALDAVVEGTVYG